MNTNELLRLEAEILKLTVIIKELSENPATGNVAFRLSFTNKYLREMYSSEVLRKDGNGEYVHQLD